MSMEVITHKHEGSTEVIMEALKTIVETLQNPNQDIEGIRILVGERKEDTDSEAVSEAVYEHGENSYQLFLSEDYGTLVIKRDDGQCLLAPTSLLAFTVGFNGTEGALEPLFKAFNSNATIHASAPSERVYKALDWFTVDYALEKGALEGPMTLEEILEAMEMDDE